MPDSDKPIWIVSDSKPGHVAQSRGLASALARLTPGVRLHELTLNPNISALEMAKKLPGPPRLILSTGRRTYAAALGLRKKFGGRAIAMMNPGWLNRRRFDLSVIPEHDAVAEGAKVVTTCGALNAIRPSPGLDWAHGLILVGGPSHHHDWDNKQFYEHLLDLFAERPGMQWTATTSRRTPNETTAALYELVGQDGANMTFVPAEHTPSGWVADRLSECGEVWVSEDSVSMVYEALSSGARVGLLPVPRAGKAGRVVLGVQQLIDRGRVVTLEAWLKGTPLANDLPPLQEAERVAQWILQERAWLSD